MQCTIEMLYVLKKIRNTNVYINYYICIRSYSPGIRNKFIVSIIMENLLSIRCALYFSFPNLCLIFVLDFQ